MDPFWTFLTAANNKRLFNGLVLTYGFLCNRKTKSIIVMLILVVFRFLKNMYFCAHERHR